MKQDITLGTFISYDTEHQRSNIFHHISVGLLAGKKDLETGFISVDLKLTHCYGYYSHKIPEGGVTSGLDGFLKFFANVNFRLDGFYAELLPEALINIDMGFGIMAGPFFEVAELEKERVLGEISRRLVCERNFFAGADAEARELTVQKNFQGKAAQKFYEEKKIFLREKYYQAKLESVDQRIADQHRSAELLEKEHQYRAGKISEKEFRQYKLRAVDDIHPFKFAFGDKGYTCKSMSIKLFSDCLDEDDHTGKRKILFREMQGNNFMQAVPRGTPHLSRTIFHTVQPEYRATEDSISFPVRTLQDENVNCLLLVSENNVYTDLEGKKHKLFNIQHTKQYINLIENVVLLKRFLNDFCFCIQNSQIFLKLIDEALALMMANSHDTKQVIHYYHRALKELYADGCFTNIARDVFKTNQSLTQLGDLATYAQRHKIRLEDGVRKELGRLITMKKQAEKDSIEDEILPRPGFMLMFANRISDTQISIKNHIPQFVRSNSV